MRLSSRQCSANFNHILGGECTIQENPSLKETQAFPEPTAVRVALWRALHLAIDKPPHVFIDPFGELLTSEANWRERPDMEPKFSKEMRASIVARSRFVEDLVEEREKCGLTQYVILGAGLDTFSLRKGQGLPKLHIFELDRPVPQAWKQKRFQELGWEVPSQLHFVSVDFETQAPIWWSSLPKSGYKENEASLVSSLGVSMYLTRETNEETLRLLSRLPTGSIFAMSFLFAPSYLSAEEKERLEFVMSKAKSSGTPFLSLFEPLEIMNLARGAGFQKVHLITGEDLNERYFLNREDGLKTGNGEGILLARAFALSANTHPVS